MNTTDVRQLAKAVRDGVDCAHALIDALLEAGQLRDAQHIRLHVEEEGEFKHDWRRECPFLGGMITPRAPVDDGQAL